MLITRSDDGYFGLKRSLAGVLGEAVAQFLVEPAFSGRKILHGVAMRRDTHASVNSLGH